MGYDDILNYMPNDGLKSAVETALSSLKIRVDEVRLRIDKPLSFVSGYKIYFITENGSITEDYRYGYRITKAGLNSVFRAICENSVYAYLDEIRKGFVTIKGGHRVGFVGRAICGDNGSIQNFRDISSLNIRIAREVPGCADCVIDYINSEKKIKNTLIISPPSVGKTTVLRDIARQLSEKGYKVGIADDRGEISAMYRGIPQNNIGNNTDVIENAPKSEGITILLRTMSPSVIITDEIVSADEVRAVCYAHGTGTAIIASAHGYNFDEVMSKPVYKPLFYNNIFENIILLKRDVKKQVLNFEIKEIGVKHEE